MARVTNRVDPSALRALLAAPPRATLAWEHEGSVRVAPVRYRAEGPRHYIGVVGEEAPHEGARASLVVDDGWSWFALRAVTIRGRLAACPPPPGAEASAWLELRPERITAWDYGQLREEPGP